MAAGVDLQTVNQTDTPLAESSPPRAATGSTSAAELFPHKGQRDQVG